MSGIRAHPAYDARERLAHDPASELWGEHRSRYRFAQRLLAPLGPQARVLDVACGVGFGLPMLREAGARVLGIDLDPAALADARALDRRAPVVRADATLLPLPDASLDLVTSFETVEHVPDAAALVADLRRVLRPGGHLVLSTPNRDFGPPERHASNPFHVREFTAPELRDLLATAFDEVRLYGQRVVAAYRFVPFLMVTPDRRPAALAWKAVNRLPFAVKDGLARAASRRPFYPSEQDFWFDPDGTEGAHALLAVAR